MKNPFNISRVNERIKIHVDLKNLMSIFGVFIVLSLATGVIVSCVNKFECTEFIPTVSYLAAHMFYDRWAVFIASILISPLLLFFLSSFLTYREYMNCADSWTLLFISFLVSFALPFTVIIDEISPSWYYPLDRIHAVVLGSVVSVLCVWIVFSLEWLVKIYRKTKDETVKFVIIYVLMCLLSLYISYSQWKNSDIAGSYYFLAINEYITILLLAFLPRAYCYCINPINISLENSKLSLVD